MAASLRHAFDAGVTVAMGSDAGNPNTPHGVGLLYELEALEAAGFEPETLLKAATLGGAAALGLEHELGRLASRRTSSFMIATRARAQRTSGQFGRLFSAEGGSDIASYCVLPFAAEAMDSQCARHRAGFYPNLNSDLHNCFLSLFLEASCNRIALS